MNWRSTCDRIGDFVFWGSIVTVCVFVVCRICESAPIAAEIVRGLIWAPGDL
jgi:hypothetical protein